jgi:hypothetical protein
VIISKHISCRGCNYQQHGDCLWFARPKSIPHEVFSKGCKHRVSKVESIPHHPAVERIVDLFHGELI